MNNLLNETDFKFRNLIGKRVKIIYKNQTHVGILQFAGVNPLHGKFQVTLSGAPLWPINPNSLVEYNGDK